METEERRKPLNVQNKKICAIHALIRSKKWKKLRKLLDWIDKQSWRTSPKIPISKDFLCIRAGHIGEVEENALHLACSNGAPLDIIERLCTICPYLASEVGPIHKRTALHCAVSSIFPNIDIVDFLLNVNPHAASAKDSNNRSPLHEACDRKEFNSKLEDVDYFMVGLRNTLLNKEIACIISALCAVSSSSVNEEDNFGMTPIEYAIDSELSVNALKHLWQGSCRNWNARLRRKECFIKIQPSFCATVANLSGEQSNTYAISGFSHIEENKQCRRTNFYLN